MYPDRLPTRSLPRMIPGWKSHTAPAVAVVQILEGVCAFTLNGEEHMLNAGDYLVMQPDTPHSLRAPERFKMLLTKLNA